MSSGVCRSRDVVPGALSWPTSTRPESSWEAASAARAAATCRGPVSVQVRWSRGPTARLFRIVAVRFVRCCTCDARWVDLTRSVLIVPARDTHLGSPPHPSIEPLLFTHRPVPIELCQQAVGRSRAASATQRCYAVPTRLGAYDQHGSHERWRPAPIRMNAASALSEPSLQRCRHGRGKNLDEHTLHGCCCER